MGNYGVEHKLEDGSRIRIITTNNCPECPVSDLLLEEYICPACGSNLKLNEVKFEE